MASNDLLVRFLPFIACTTVDAIIRLLSQLPMHTAVIKILFSQRRKEICIRLKGAIKNSNTTFEVFVNLITLISRV